jgi:hypothetical protein
LRHNRNGALGHAFFTVEGASMATRLTTTRRRVWLALRLLCVSAVIACTAVLATLLAPAAGAATPGDPSPDARYYVSAVTGIEPATTGLEVVVHGGGETITLTNRTGKTVVVVGYSGEDYLRITGSAVDENANSLTALLNRTRGRGEVPEKFSSKNKLPVRWQRVNTTNTITWQDFRTRWGAEQRPPIVAQQPHSRHQVFAWAIQLKVGNQPALVRGDVTWTGVPGSDRSPLLAIIAGAVLVLALLGLFIALRSRRRRLAASRTISRVQPGPRPGARTSHQVDDRADDRVADSTGARY